MRRSTTVTIASLTFAAIAATLPAQGSAATPAPVIAIKAGRLIDGRGGAPMSPAMVRIEGDRIVAVGSTLPVPPGARVIDLGSATLLPGLFSPSLKDWCHWR